MEPQEDHQETEDEHEVEYLFVSFEDADPPPVFHEGASLTLEGLLTAAPTATIGGQRFAGTFDDDIGSTLFFDRNALKRASDVEAYEVSNVATAPPASDHTPELVCITTKRLKLEAS